jgi:phosphoribosyl 1,2-cyclic phosphodiesterase
VSREVALRVRFWGVRGSHPAPGPTTVRVGGNSSCVEVEAGRHALVFDAGTGIIELGRRMLRDGSQRDVHIFLSHTHHDHIEGLRFFEPVYRCDWSCHLYGPGRGTQTLERILRGAMEPSFFPVSLSELPSHLHIRDLRGDELIRLNSRPVVEVVTHHSQAHPKTGVRLYRVACRGRSLVYATDVEAAKGGHDDVVAFARGADVLIHDAQYTEEEYFGGHITKAGWGHSTVRMAAEVAREAGVGELLLYHHDPIRNDAAVARLERAARKIFPATRAAREGMEIEL